MPDRAPIAQRIGITTTLPIELIYGAGFIPCDLNNLFIGMSRPADCVEAAERAAIPQNVCAWIKGLYGAVHQARIHTVLGVLAGDCAETEALLEILASENIRILPFAYPYTRHPEDLDRELSRLAQELGTTIEAGEEWKCTLDDIRETVAKIDAIAYTQGTVHSGELFSVLLGCTDFEGDPEGFHRRAQAVLEDVRCREAPGPRLRLGVLGVPTIYTDLWNVIETLGARVVFHEVPHDFSRISSIGSTLQESYLDLNYPYDISTRLRAIQGEVETRQLDGILHYVQSFCHRQLHDRLLREGLHLPILTLEGDRPGPLDGRGRVRLEAFLEQLHARAT